MQFLSIWGRGVNIIIVDDKQHVAEPLVFILANLGHKVLAFDHSDGALSHLAHNGTEPYLMITDHQIGGISGLELYHRSSALLPEVNTIVISDRIRCSQLDRVHIVRKPLDPERIIEMISSIELKL